MKTAFRKYAAILTALLALCAQGCSKAPAAEDTLVQLIAPTVEPVVTPVPTPVATPTPVPTEKPKTTKKPKATEKPKDTPAPTEKPKDSTKTPYHDSYTPVELREYSRKAEDFSSKAIDGSTVTQEYFAKGKLTVVNVWTTT